MGAAAMGPRYIHCGCLTFCSVVSLLMPPPPPPLLSSNTPALLVLWETAMAPTPQNVS